MTLTARKTPFFNLRYYAYAANNSEKYCFMIHRFIVCLFDRDQRAPYTLSERTGSDKKPDLSVCTYSTIE